MVITACDLSVGARHLSAGAADQPRLSTPKDLTSMPSIENLITGSFKAKSKGNKGKS